MVKKQEKGVSGGGRSSLVAMDKSAGLVYNRR